MHQEQLEDHGTSPSTFQASPTILSLTFPHQTFRNQRAVAAYIQEPCLAAHVHNLVAAVGTEGISSDEEGEPSHDRWGRAREYLVFDKPWHAKHLVDIYCWLDRKHAETRNIQGAPIRTRIFRPSVTQGNTAVPRGLPIDCYNGVYLHSLPSVQRRTLRPEPAVNVESLWLGVIASDLEAEEN